MSRDLSDGCGHSGYFDAPALAHALAPDVSSSALRYHLPPRYPDFLCPGKNFDDGSPH